MFDEAEDIFFYTAGKEKRKRRVRSMAAKASIYSVGSTKGPLCGNEDVTAQCGKQEVSTIWKAGRDHSLESWK